MTPATNIYLVRHGQTEWNVAHRMQGHQDSPLTELGLTQAQWLADAFVDKPLDLIYSSTSYRAFRTAEIIKNNKNIDIVQLDEFREINLGEWEGQTQTEIKAAFPESFNHFWNNPEAYQPNGGEAYSDVMNRAYEKLLEIISLNAGKHILIVTHTVVIKLLMTHFEQKPLTQLWDLPYIHPVCLCHLRVENDEPTIILHGDISHYQMQLTEE
ncbi:histidine phosphatase family protein [Paenibacillus psychroresistens]|uniref:Histidine phosphatase family protein n=1 Tax=Paenibacillus psychroresistens TaxID=1778678 RepID=A0A6B8RSL0_9BACL|nr:histidine phosphatase family protein [Paenibacillus psychroresistens]QGQ99431.1 histidine phosphatase family protein [Paenibacillus psychroresistens]